MSASDKKILNNLNPNISCTLSDINATSIEIMDAKEEDALSLLITENPHILQQIRTTNLLNVNDETCETGYLSSSGTLSSNASDTAGPYISVTPGQDIYYTGIVGPTNSSSINRRLHVYNANKQWIKQLNFHGSLTIGSSWSTHGVVPSNGAYVRVSWGSTDQNVMVSLGAPTKYEPYYITPFDEITSVSFQLASDSTLNNAITYTTVIPNNITDTYSFKYNPILGKLYLTTGYINSYNGETLPGLWWSDRNEYSEGTIPTTGAQVIYMLADEDIEEYNITPSVVEMFYRRNYLTVGQDSLINSITYYAETFGVDHITINNGIRFDNINIYKETVESWNHAADEIDLKAPIDSPVFTGSPQAPTVNINVNSDRLATTAFVQTKMNNIAPLEPSNRASRNYEVGQYMFFGGYMCKVTNSIAQNATIAVGTNIEITDVATELLYLLSLIQGS